MKKAILFVLFIVLLSSSTYATCNETLYNYTGGDDTVGYTWNTPRNFSGGKFIVNGTNQRNITSITARLKDNVASTGTVYYDIWNGTKNESGYANSTPSVRLTATITPPSFNVANVNAGIWATFNYPQGIIVNNNDVLFAIGNGTGVAFGGEVGPGANAAGQSNQIWFSNDKTVTWSTVTNYRNNLKVYGCDYIPPSPDTTPPTLSSLNCTSCNVPYGDNQSPYETEDTTPTFNVTTNEEADCRIGRTDQNYTTMGASRDCTSTGGTSHTCTLTVQDRFASVGENYLYISCKDSSGNEGNISDHSKSNSGPIRMEIMGASETPGDNAIEIGMQTSEIWPCSVYSEQRVSARNLANSQFTGIFDRVAVKGNKRWAFNYVSEGESEITPLFNLSTVLYVLQLKNQTNETITDQVGKLINSTWP